MEKGKKPGKEIKNYLFKGSAQSNIRIDPQFVNRKQNGERFKHSENLLVMKHAEDLNSDLGREEKMTYIWKSQKQAQMPTSTCSFSMKLS